MTPLNPFAPAWTPGMLYNDRIAAVVKHASNRSLMAPTNCIAGYGLPEQPIFDLTYEEALAAATLHPGVIQLIYQRHRTYELCLAALSTAPRKVIEIYNLNGENFPLFHVPLEHRNETMCLAAAAWCNRALWYWPRALRTKEMYVKAAKLNPSTVSTMAWCGEEEIQAAAETVAKWQCISLEAALVEVRKLV